MLIMISENTLRDKSRNEFICNRMEIASIKNKMRDNCFRWFGHVQRRPLSEIVRKGELNNIEGVRRDRVRPK